MTRDDKIFFTLAFVAILSIMVGFSGAVLLGEGVVSGVGFGGGFVCIFSLLNFCVFQIWTDGF